MKAKIEKKLAEVEKSFETFRVEMEGLKEKRAVIDRRMAEVQTEQVRLQGSHRDLTAVLADLEPEDKKEKRPN